MIIAMIKYLILIVGIMLIIQSCNDGQTIEIDDFQQAKVFGLNSSNESFFTTGNYVVSATMRVEGFTDGKVKITGTSPVGGEFFGKVDTFMRNDWFCDTVSIIVIPQGNVTGHSKITFTFVKI